MKFSAFLCAMAVAIPLYAQTPTPIAPRRGNAEALAKGWSALAAGRASEAEALADTALTVSPRSHDAAALKVRARLAGGRETTALDAYDQWATAVRQDDVFLLQPIAVAVLDTLSLSNDRTVRAQALGTLAAAGDERARAKLAEGSADASFREADDVLAAAGDRAAIGRLRAQVEGGGSRDLTAAIDALRDANAKDAIPAILKALGPSNPPPTRMAAARALGQLGATDAIPQLQQAAQDQNAALRIAANAALARLGDPGGQDALRQMQNSPIADLRLLAVEDSAATDPNGPWLAVAQGAMQDADPLVRLRAAGLVAKYAPDPRPGTEAIQQALADPNPAMQVAASRELNRIPASVLAADMAALRRGLRAQTAEVRLASAAAILRLAGGVD